MNNLRRIGNSRRKGPDFLGVFGSFLIETLDDDKIIEKLTPRFFNNWREVKRLSGPNAWMILKNFSNEALVIIKSKGSNAELVVYINHSIIPDEELIADVRRLASHRWPNQCLRVKVKTINQMRSECIETFKRNGWKETIDSKFVAIDLFEK